MKAMTGLLPAALLILALSGCNRREAKDVVVAAPTVAGAADPHAGAARGADPHAGMARMEPVIQIPEAVKARWKHMRIGVLDLAAKKEATYEVEAGRDFTIPGSDLTLRPLAIVPDFTMDAGVISSKSNEANNPAAQVILTEGGKPIFKGWLFARFPETHPFEHPKYALRLLEVL
ncbi:MAG TPA: hypothetical protein VF804_10170 [Holophagaceae bacterium]